MQEQLPKVVHVLAKQRRQRDVHRQRLVHHTPHTLLTTLACLTAAWSAEVCISLGLYLQPTFKTAATAWEAGDAR